jgi:hypothetical protein
MDAPAGQRAPLYRRGHVRIGGEITRLVKVVRGYRNVGSDLQGFILPGVAV